MTETKMERDGPSAISAYPIPAATVILLQISLSLSLSNQSERQKKKLEDGVSDLRIRVIVSGRISNPFVLSWALWVRVIVSARIFSLSK